MDKQERKFPFSLELALGLSAVSHFLFKLKKKKNSNTRKRRNIFRARGENRFLDPPSSSSDGLTTELLEL